LWWGKKKKQKTKQPVQKRLKNDQALIAKKSLVRKGGREDTSHKGKKPRGQKRPSPGTKLEKRKGKPMGANKGGKKGKAAEEVQGKEEEWTVAGTSGGKNRNPLTKKKEKKNDGADEKMETCVSHKGPLWRGKGEERRERRTSPYKRGKEKSVVA